MMQTAPTKTRVLCVSAALREGAAYLKQRGIDTPQREAEHLLSAVLRCSRLHLLLEGQSGLPQAAHDRFWRYLRRRATREPLQYITGQVEFCGMTFSVSKGVFIPRPETELIVEAAKTLPPPRRILDLCTGSGALAVTLACVFPKARVIGVDCASSALAVASANARTHGVFSRTSFFRGDLFTPLKTRNANEKFDLIVSNPPYISLSDRETLPPEVGKHEPEAALFAPDEGRDFYRRILAESPLFLTENGVILFELGVGHGVWLKSYLEGVPDSDQQGWCLDLLKDWAGIDRVACLSKRPAKTAGRADG